MQVLTTPVLATGLRALLFMAAKAPVMQHLEAGWNPVAISMLTGVGCCLAANLLSEVAVLGLAGSSREDNDWRATLWASAKQTSLTRIYLVRPTSPTRLLHMSPWTRVWEDQSLGKLSVDRRGQYRIP